jgi:hypothetical protein
MKEKFISSYLCQLLIRYVKEKRDNEFEQALVRVLIGLVLIYYFNDLQFSQAQAVAANALNLVFVPSLFVIAAVSMAACVYFWPGEMPIVLHNLLILTTRSRIDARCCQCRITNDVVC